MVPTTLVNAAASIYKWHCIWNMVLLHTIFGCLYFGGSCSCDWVSVLGIQHVGLAFEFFADCPGNRNITKFMIKLWEVCVSILLYSFMTFCAVSTLLPTCISRRSCIRCFLAVGCVASVCSLIAPMYECSQTVHPCCKHYGMIMGLWIMRVHDWSVLFVMCNTLLYAAICHWLTNGYAGLYIFMSSFLL